MQLFRSSFLPAAFVVGLLLASTSWAAPLPDLKITNVQWDTSCSVGFQVCNVGSGDATGLIFFTASPLSNPVWGSGPQTGWNGGINGLAAGDCANETWGPTHVIGSYMQVTLDPQNLIAESNEGNNVKVVQVPAPCIAPCR